MRFLIHDQQLFYFGNARTVPIVGRNGRRNDLILTNREVSVLSRLLVVRMGRENILQKARKLATLNRIKWHPEGGSLNRVGLWTLLAYLCILGTIPVAVSVAVLNVHKEDTRPDRVLEGLQVISFLWVSVFGLLKQYSDDDRIIKNTFLCRIIFKKAEDIIGYLGCSDAEELKRLLLETRNDWIAPSECSYATHVGSGRIVALGGITIRQIIQSGHFVLSDQLVLRIGGDGKDTTFDWKKIVPYRTSSFILEAVPQSIIDNIETQLSVDDVIFRLI